MQLTFKIVYSANQWPAEAETISKRNPLTIAILDSSFNPPTLAHKELLLRTAAESPADAYLLLFSINNADKQLTGATAEQRVKMMKLMAETIYSQYPACNVAVAVTEHARFFEKANEIHAWYESHYPGKEAQLAFIMGYDTVIRLVNQKYYDQPVEEALEPFFSKNKVICADRGGHSKEDVDNFWKNNKIVAQFQSSFERISLGDITANISSTKVRSQIHNNQDIRQSVDDKIYQYVRKHQLYSV
jgi:nicotinate (nicotinamide) nucleotide adenylyltransferase